MATKEDEQKEILKISIRELTNKYNLVNGIHDQLRTRVLGMLTLIIALGTFIFYDFSDLKPDEFYGVFMLGFASVLFGAVFIALLAIIFSGEWHSPVEIKDIKRAEKIYKTEIDYLKYIRDDYIVAVSANIAKVGRNGKIFNHCIYVFIVSAIILLAIKGG